MSCAVHGADFRLCICDVQWHFVPPPALEFRPDYKGRFDEIVARFADGMVHVETMSKTGCYVGFYWDDGRWCQWWINSAKKLEYSHDDGVDPPTRFTAQGVDRGGDAGVSFHRPIARGDLYHRLKRINELSRDGLDIGAGPSADVARMERILNKIEKLAEGRE